MSPNIIFICFANFVINMCMKGQPRIENNPQVFILENKLHGMILNDIVMISKCVLRNFRNISFIWIKGQRPV